MPVVNSPDYKRPESVLVIVCTSGGDVLLLQRLQPPDFWQSVTGSLEGNETPQQAARRELFEETGLAVEVQDCRRSNEFAIHPAWRSRYAPGVQSNREHVFVARCERRPDIRLNPQEHQRYCWLPRERAAQRASSYTNRDAILEFVAAADPAASETTDA
jgi:dATP pyrophosphohydrolase